MFEAKKYQEHLIVIQTIKHVTFLFKTESIFFPLARNLIYNSPFASIWKTETQSDFCSPLCWTVAPREVMERQPCPP